MKLLLPVFALSLWASLHPKRSPSQPKNWKSISRRKTGYSSSMSVSRMRSQAGMVPGYVNIPLGQFENRLKEIPKDKLIVTL